MTSYRWTWSQTIFNITLEDHSVRFRETESLILADKSCPIRSKSGKDCRIDWTPVIINDGEGGSGIFCHSKTATSEDSVRCLIWDLNLEGKLVTNTHSLNFFSSIIQDGDSWGRRFGCRGDTDHIRISDWHHTEGYIS